MEILSAAYAAIKPHLTKSRYELYQSRFFDFGIAAGDKVLDIGSGHLPFPLATDLADITLSDDGYGRARAAMKVVAGRPLYECNVENMPFADREFDFVYCSHVLEHVANPENACAELMRVGKRGYIETPARAKDLFLNTAKVSNHRWAVAVEGNKLIFSEYSAEEIEGLGCGILLEMNCAPRGRRERALAGLLALRENRLNTALLWQGEFDVEVRRRRERSN